MPTEMAEGWVREIETNAARAARRVAVPMALLLGLVAGLLIGQSANATSRSAAQPVATWRPVELQSEAPVYGPPARGKGTPGDAGNGQNATGAPLDPPRLDPQGLDHVGPGNSGASPSPVPSPRRAAVPGSSLRLSATFYCNADARRGPLSRCTRGYPDRRGVSDLYAAISPDLVHLRGKVLDVWRGSAHVRVKVVDCNCAARMAIDLYADAFARLAPLSLGRITVTVRW